MLELYSDGGCNVKTDKRGAWAFIVVENDEKVIFEKFGPVPNTTNGEMEVIGLKEALKYAIEELEGQKVIIKCDSSYCVDAYNDWAFNWAKKGWRKANNKPIEHPVHWQEIHTLRNKNITVEWVRGHNGNQWNEYVDKLCKNR